MLNIDAIPMAMHNLDAASYEFPVRARSLYGVGAACIWVNFIVVSPSTRWPEVCGSIRPITRQ
jgi:hypothetical protein